MLNDHRWVLVSDEDPDEHEVCVDCGKQRNRKGDDLPRATMTGGFRFEDCEKLVATNPDGLPLL